MYSQYKATRNCHLQRIMTVKEEHWNAFLASAHWKDVITALRNTKPWRCERTITLQAPSNPTLATTFQKEAKPFWQTLFPPSPSVTIQDTNPGGKNRMPWQNLNNNEIGKAIVKWSLYNALGPDGIELKCVQEVCHSIPQNFNSLYKAYVKAGYHTRICREATIALIRKHNKPYYTILKANYPISPLNWLKKVSEKIITTCLGKVFEQYDLLHKWQIGGRRKRPGVDACMLIATPADNAKHKGLTGSSLRMDIQGALTIYTIEISSLH